ncbi:MAG: kynureninase [Saprospiraceae bacterium]|nr:kynureninase [Saprospiraceae bacterium]MBK8451259.1 kynureninase [Saprospiraceae bacterium]MBK8483220.1 kynureninase [Saprospiraceae bacterium]MBK9220732.1 kynureninase [Saprospiraceae bacterium]MBK9722423.1 kynureninase [Saprospiraceae bacterium]
MSVQRKEVIALDEQDPLKHFKSQFLFPKTIEGHDYLYFCGNSLGLQAQKTRGYVDQELLDWAQFGVTGHHNAKNPWYKYHEFLTDAMANIIGAKPIETVIMNTLTVNLHLMMVSFYRPTKQRFKILIEHSTFPSDRYAVESQIRFHGFDPKEALLILKPEPGEDYISKETIQSIFEKEGDTIALALIGSVNYYTGQAYPIPFITKLAHESGCKIGFDLAHGAGNLFLNLHEDGPDFATWCGYKYLNGGPGSLAGCFVHERHAYNYTIPKFAGWWGHNKMTRFKMEPLYESMPGAEGWQLSNPPILPMACLLASLELFKEAGMKSLRKKSLELGNLLFTLLDELKDPNISIITPKSEDERGCQISIKIKNADKKIFHRISKNGVIADWREPDVIRIAPVPLYNTFTDVFEFMEILKNAIHD